MHLDSLIPTTNKIIYVNNNEKISTEEKKQ